MIFSLSRRLMRHFGAVIRIDLIEVFHGRHDRAVRGGVALEFVGHQPSWFTALAFEEMAKEAFGRLFISPMLHENINRVAVLVHGPPQIVLLPLNRDKDFIKVPGISQTPLALFQLARILRPKLLTPLSNRFIGDGDAPFGEQLFDFTEAETEPMVEPDSVGNNFGRKAIALVAGRFGFHGAQSANPELN